MAPWLIQLLILIGSFILSIVVGTLATAKIGSFLSESDNVYAKANLAYSTRSFTFGGIAVLLLILFFRWWKVNFFVYAALAISFALMILMFFYLVDAVKPRVRKFRTRLMPTALLYMLAAAGMAANLFFNLYPFIR